MALIVVAGALRGPDGYLVARRAPTERAYPGCWELPGGKVHRDVTWCERCGIEDVPFETGHAECMEQHGGHAWTTRDETLVEAVVREWREETGIAVTVTSHVTVLREFTTPQHGHVKIFLIDIVAHRYYPTELPVHSCAMYMTPEQMLRVPEWAATPSLHPFARALRDRP